MEFNYVNWKTGFNDSQDLFVWKKRKYIKTTHKENLFCNTVKRIFKILEKCNLYFDTNHSMESHIIFESLYFKKNLKKFRN